MTNMIIEFARKYHYAHDTVYYTEKFKKLLKIMKKLRKKGLISSDFYCDLADALLW